jgi:hypothetical protein
MSRSTQNEDEVAHESTPLLPREDEKYSVFSATQKTFIIFIGGFAATFSQLSSNIYYPAIKSLERELHVGDSLMNLTITAYMVGLDLVCLTFTYSSGPPRHSTVIYGQLGGHCWPATGICAMLYRIYSSKYWAKSPVELLGTSIPAGPSKYWYQRHSCPFKCGSCRYCYLGRARLISGYCFDRIGLGTSSWANHRWSSQPVVGMEVYFLVSVY